MREEQPVFRVPGTDLYFVTRYDLFGAILRDTATFSSAFTFGTGIDRPVREQLREIVAQGWPPVPTLLTADPPRHTRYRATVAGAFGARRIAQLRPVVADIVHRLIDGWIGDGHVEVVRHFAVPVPVEVIAAVLDISTDHLDDFKRWSDDSVAAIGAAISDERRLEAQRGIVELQHHLAAELEARRAQARDDLMSELVAATIIDDGDEERPLTTAEILSILQQLLVAGNETTTNALAEGVLLLATHPAQWAALQADPEGRAPALAEEVLRLASPTQGMFRVVTRDVELGGVTVPAGSRLVVLFAAANRDPDVFADPDELDPDRGNVRDHVAFGKGIHFCLGAPLARLELQVALAGLATRLGSLSLVEGAPLDYHPSFVLRGLERLDIEFTASEHQEAATSGAAGGVELR
jgi:cytochrome P450